MYYIPLFSFWTFFTWHVDDSIPEFSLNYGLKNKNRHSECSSACSLTGTNKTIMNTAFLFCFLRGRKGKKIQFPQSSAILAQAQQQCIRRNAPCFGNIFALAFLLDFWAKCSGFVVNDIYWQYIYRESIWYWFSWNSAVNAPLTC